MGIKILSIAIGLFFFFKMGQPIPKAQFFGMHGTFLEVVDEGFAGPIQLTQDFKFFNATHRSLYVSHNGAVSFLKGIRSFRSVCGVLDSQSKMIAPYWGDVDIRRGGHIRFRESTSQEDINQANRQLARSFLDYSNLQMNWTFTATWEDVPFYRGKPSATDRIGICANDNARNTFQLTLTTDGIRSFAIFYYDKLEWTTGTLSGGNCSGLGGRPAKAGFDVGDGKNFFPIPDSCTQNVRNIANSSNVNEIGVWIWRIDGGLEAPPTPQPSTIQVPDSPTPQPSTTQVPDSPTPQPSTTQVPDSPTLQPSTTQVPDSPTPQPSTTQAPDSPTPQPSTTQQPDSPTSTIPEAFSTPPPISRPNPPPQCPPRRPTTPCRESIVNIVEHVVDFINNFPSLCLGKACGIQRPITETTTAAPYTQTPSTTHAPNTDAPSTTPVPSTELPSTTVEAVTETPTTTEDPTTEVEVGIESEEPPECAVDNDLAILLDSSGSVGANNYQLSKDFVANLSHAFTQNPGNRLLFIDFSNNAVLRVPLAPRRTPAQIEATIRATPWQRRMTHTGKALDLARTQLMANRRGVPQSLIIFTDGGSTDQAIPKAVQVRNAGINIFAVGIGAGINREELLSIAGDESRRHIVETFDGLRTILLDVIRELCPSQPT